MPPISRDYSTIADQWLANFDGRMAQTNIKIGLICSELAHRYKCDPSTIRRHLDTDYAIRRRKANRQSEEKRYAPIKALNYKRRYEMWYRRLTRRTDVYLEEIFHERDEANLDEIVQSTHDITRDRRYARQVEFSSTTVERIFRRYSKAQLAGEARGPPWLYEHPPSSRVWHYDDKLSFQREYTM